MINQTVITENELGGILKGHRPMLVCGQSFSKTPLYTKLNETVKDLVQFSEFEPNPSYDSVVKAVNSFRDHGCDFMIVAGGGSAMDTGKCAKLFINMDEKSGCYLDQVIKDNHIPILAIPTTAGTGSEATRYSIIYYNGEKKTVTHESSIPEYVLFDGKLLSTLPDYQRKSTMLDALCHAIESYWSVKSDDLSKAYADEAIRSIYSNMQAYLENSLEGNEAMLMAANVAGKAINITGTTAAHALCYKPTKTFNIAHGHAVALTIPYLWDIMIDKIDDCNDSRGSDYVMDIFQKIASAMGCATPSQAVNSFLKMLEDFKLLHTVQSDKETLDYFAGKVDISRLSSTPVKLLEDDIISIYGKTYL